MTDTLKGGIHVQTHFSKRYGRYVKKESISSSNVLISSQAGVNYCFVNLGSDHPAIMEAMTKGKKYKPDSFPEVITCPSEVS